MHTCRTYATTAMWMMAVAAWFSGHPATAQVLYRAVDLTEWAAPSGVVQCEARGINDAGQIIGFELFTDESFTARAILWLPDGSVEFPPRLPGDNSTYAYSVAANGVICGDSELVTVEHRGDLIIIHQDVGGGARNGELGHGFLLTPIIPGDLDGDADVDLTDLAILLSDFGCTGGACPGDADGDGDTDIADLAILLANYGAGP